MIENREIDRIWKDTTVLISIYSGSEMTKKMTDQWQTTILTKKWHFRLEQNDSDNTTS